MYLSNEWISTSQSFLLSQVFVTVCKWWIKNSVGKFLEEITEKMVSTSSKLIKTVSFSSQWINSFTLFDFTSAIKKMRMRECNVIGYILDRNLDKTQEVLLTHGDCIDRVADTFRVVASSGNFLVGIANDKLRLYGLQFHPEVIRNFNVRVQWM